MDFKPEYTKEQEEFRKEVRAWVEENARYPEELGPIPLSSGDMSREMWLWGRDFQRKLGAKGWYYPTYPKEYGGGGLSGDKDIIIKEELRRVEHPVAYSMVSMAAPALLVYGTEEQKQRLLKPMLRGEMVAWQAFTEPGAGSDLASLQTRAVRDGDDFIITGEKCFIGGHHEPDVLWAPVMTDPDAPRHMNLGAFVIPANLPGISIRFQNLVIREGKRAVTFEGARVSREYLVGGETQGWRVIQSSLEIEHGGGGSVLPEDDPIVTGALEFCKKTLRNGVPLSSDPAIQKEMVDLYIEANVHRLIGMRNHWMHNNNVPGTYHGSQNSLVGKYTALRSAVKLLNALGPFALTVDPKWGALEGKVEDHQRHTLGSDHRGGTIDVQKVIIARRIGISRTRERAAPTRAQAG
ncbi:MAG: hypothetical protein HW388_470 [Dehalococcoidia bacterium]|nr:hypothetical protein [Dehalococcoidia bacterium]